MVKLKAKIYIPDKEFSENGGDYKEITVIMNEPNKEGEVMFEADIPLHVFEKLKDTSDHYKTKENGGKFKRKVRLPSFKYLCETIESYCYDAKKSVEVENLNKVKKLFIKFDFGNRLTRDNWCGAGTGNVLNTRFQFFVGYKVVTTRKKILSFEEEKEVEFIKYYSEYVELVKGVAGTYKLGTLQPLNMDWKHKEVENTYVIVDWTQEREDFLQSIEDTFNELGIKLNMFLGDLDGAKLDNLIENNQKLLG